MRESGVPGFNFKSVDLFSIVILKVPPFWPACRWLLDESRMMAWAMTVMRCKPGCKQIITNRCCKRNVIFLPINCKALHLAGWNLLRCFRSIGNCPRSADSRFFFQRGVWYFIHNIILLLQDLILPTFNRAHYPFFASWVVHLVIKKPCLGM